MKTKWLGPPKLDYAEVPDGHKSARVYGARVKFIFAMVKFKRLRTFTNQDFGPQINAEQSKSILNHLERQGRIQKVKHGTPGSYGEPAIYRLK
jgi:hypothetical protein